jgi:hypothetical protein
MLDASGICHRIHHITYPHFNEILHPSTGKGISKPINQSSVQSTSLNAFIHTIVSAHPGMYLAYVYITDRD